MSPPVRSSTWRACMARQRANSGRDLRRGDEIALAADLARPGGVVAEARRVERELHEARERDPAALLRRSRWRCARPARGSARPLRAAGAGREKSASGGIGNGGAVGDGSRISLHFRLWRRSERGGAIPEEYSTMGQPVVLVTGGARRVGAAIVRAAHAAGARVVVHCNRSRGEAEALLAGLEAARPGTDGHRPGATSSTSRACRASWRRRRRALRAPRRPREQRLVLPPHAPRRPRTPPPGTTSWARTCARRSSSPRRRRRTCAARAAPS